MISAKKNVWQEGVEFLHLLARQAAIVDRVPHWQIVRDLLQLAGRQRLAPRRARERPGWSPHSAAGGD